MSRRLAVITPYFEEPIAYLERCHQSVIAQGVDADHFMVADGRSRDCVDEWAVRHVRLPTSHGDYGNTPRGIGSLLAKSEDYDFIAYLDADNWYHEGHLHSLLSLWEQNSSTASCSFRTYHDEAGNPLEIFEHDENYLLHVDTSCFLIHRSGFSCLPIWLDMPKAFASIGDRVFLASLLHRKLSISSTRARTVAYRSRHRAHYLLAGQPVPEGAKDEDPMVCALNYMRTAEGVSRCIEALGFWPPSYISL